MAGGEGSGVTTSQPHLAKQDLSKLDVSKLTALSPEVISRQATTNIGTIGHVAHGKSTVVKAISGVQTVRFKNELERNITIKLGDQANEESFLTGMKLLPSPPFLAASGETSQPTVQSAAGEDQMSDSFEPKNKRRRLRKLTVRKKRTVGQKSNPVGTECRNESTNSDKISEKTSDLDDGSGSSSGVSLSTADGSIAGSTNGSDSGRDSMSTVLENGELMEEVEEEEWEVQDIVDHCCYSDKHFRYFVKWRGWEDKYNSWEHEENLVNCPEVRARYWKKYYGEFELVDYLPSRIAQEALKSALTGDFSDKESLPNLIKAYDLKSLLHKERALMKEVREMLRLNIDDKVRLERLKKKLRIRAFQIARMEQTGKLKLWESEVNTICTEQAKIFVQNTVDLEGPPENFQYVNDYVPGVGVVIPTDPPIGCDCQPSCLEGGACCGVQSGAKFAYNDQRRLGVKIGTPIYECNSRCTCPVTCNNRVVQAGRQLDLIIFRTSTGCGWGVKTSQPIKRGTFVCEYVGEVINSDEAERRGKIYDAEGRTYLFDLDYNEKDQFPYTVDAARFGNVSHFINHSCDPNLAVFAVWVNCLDPNLPKLGLFATRNIKKGEEITFDYMCQSLAPPSSLPAISPSASCNITETAFSPVSSSPRGRLSVAGEVPETSASSGNEKAPKTLCKCNAEKCRRYLF